MSSLPPSDASGPCGSVPPGVHGLDGGAAPGDGPGGGDPRRYTREGLLGKGGMGLVYLAYDTRLGRQVALKEAADGGEVAARLAAEAKVTAGLDHPGIVTVHDSGVGEDGRPFYVMRLLRGRPLGALVAERADRLGLVRHFLDACHAVAYAHAQGVVHRDLKPANIMVGGFGETQVVDWGLAARAGDPGEAVGTPAYMAPEQARGASVDPRADVWSLGAVLAELVGEQGPAELGAVVERARAADPADRYPDAGALAAEVAAWLDGRPVRAHRYTPWELLRRLVKAWRAPLLVGATALVVGIALVAAGTLRLARERTRVVAALASSDANLAQVLTAEARMAMADGSAAVAGVLASHALVLGESPEAWGVLAGVALEGRAERVGATALPACDRPVVLGPDDVVCVEPGDVSRVVGGERRWSWEGVAESVRLDGDALDVASGVRALRLDLASGAATPAGAPFGTAGNRVWPVEVAEWGAADLNDLEDRLCPGSSVAAALPVAARTAVVLVCVDGRVAVTPVGQPPTRFRTTPATREALSGLVAAELSGAGDRLVLAGSKGSLMVVDLATGQTTSATAARRDGGWLLALSADGRRLAVAGDRGEVELWTLPELEPLVSLPVSARALRFLPDGSLLVAEAQGLSRWRIPAAPAATRFRGPDGITGATFSPDGAWLATAHGSQAGLVWELATGLRRSQVDVGEGTAKAAAFTPDSAAAWFAITGPRSGWRPLSARVDGLPGEAPADALLLPAPGRPSGFPTRRVVVLASGVLLAPGYAGGGLFAMDTRTRTAAAPRGCPEVLWYDAAQSPAGEHAVLVGEGGRVVPVASGAPPACAAGFRVEGAVAADIAADGTLVVGLEREVRLTDAAGVTAWSATLPAGRVLEVAIAADGRWVAAGGTDHLARVWDRTGRLRAVLAGHDERVASVDFHPDGRRLVTGSWDGTARLWGLDILDTPAERLDAAAAATWGLGWADALALAGR